MKLPLDVEFDIRENYEYGDLNELSKRIKRRKHTISEWARRHGLKRIIKTIPIKNRDNIYRKGDISSLLNGSLQSFYWLGQLASDGYISKNGHLMFSQSEKDKHIVYEFADFVKSNVYIFTGSDGFAKRKSLTYRVNIQDHILGKKIREMWNLKDGQRKTYSSISLDFISTKEEALAFFAGFHDGDGSYYKKGNGKIEIHSSWLKTLNLLCEKCEFLSRAKINKRGYTNLYIKVSDMNDISNFLIEKNIFHNKRKYKN